MAWRLTPHRRLAVVALTLWLLVAAFLLARGVNQPVGPGGTATQVTPVGAGITRDVRSAADWDAAVAAASPGDVISLRAGIGQRLVYRGTHEGTGAGSAADGTPTAPIVITADPGIWINPADQASGQGALDVIAANHVHVVGVNVRNAQFGIRCLQCQGSPGHPVRLAGNQVTLIGHAGLVVSGHWATHAPSTWALVENNVITRTGQIDAHFGEGIYLGYGSTEWADVTAEVTVRANDISLTGAEGVDVKPGTRDIVVESNLIHDLAPIDGGGISAHYVGSTPDPHPNQVDPVLIRANRIWNQNLAGVPGSNDWAIWVGHGGVDVMDNLIWGLRADPNLVRAVRVRSTQPFGPQPIRIQGNLFWTARGWVAEGQPSGAANVLASGNRGIDPAGSDLLVDTSSFAGPVPALGTGGTADNGGGPGSGFASPNPATTTTTPPPTTASSLPVGPTTTAPTTTSTTTFRGSDIATSAGVPRTRLTTPPRGGSGTVTRQARTASRRPTSGRLQQLDPVLSARRSTSPTAAATAGPGPGPTSTTTHARPPTTVRRGGGGAAGPSTADEPTEPPASHPADTATPGTGQPPEGLTPAPGSPGSGAGPAGWPRTAGRLAVAGLALAAAELARRAVRRPVRRG